MAQIINNDKDLLQFLKKLIHNQLLGEETRETAENAAQYVRVRRSEPHTQQDGISPYLTPDEHVPVVEWPNLGALRARRLLRDIGTESPRQAQSVWEGMDAVQRRAWIQMDNERIAEPQPAPPPPPPYPTGRLDVRLQREADNIQFSREQLYSAQANLWL